MALHDFSTTPRTHWEIDPENTTIEFTVGKSRLHRVRGRFHGVRGSAVTLGDRADEATVQVEIDAVSIDTRLTMRDRHLRSERFLEVERFPTISFSSTCVEERGQAGLCVLGDLTIKGITREVTLDAAVEQRDTGGARVLAHTVLDRRDFKIGPKAMGLVVGNDVTVRIALALTETA